VTWQADRAYGRAEADVAYDWAVRQELTCQTTWRQTWANHVLTRGMFSLVEKGATWPNPGLPRGTPSLGWFGFNVKFGLASPGVEPATSGQATD
jgi:hypothetical protein